MSRRYGVQTMWHCDETFLCNGHVDPAEFVAHVHEHYGYTLDPAKVRHRWYFTGPPFDGDTDWGLYDAPDNAPGAGRYTEGWA